ncbi:MAG: PilZ domain-containing protein [Microthrixaceae bacterium]
MANFERRIGRRKAFEGFPALVTPVLKRSDGLGFQRRRRQSQVHGEVVDISLSGANITAPSKLGLTIGSSAEVRIDDDRTFVGRVKRLNPIEDGESTQYGLTYQEMAPEYREWLHKWTHSDLEQ